MSDGAQLIDTSPEMMRARTKAGPVVLVHLGSEMSDTTVADYQEYSFECKPPLGLQYLCGSLDVAGYTSEIHDQHGRAVATAGAAFSYAEFRSDMQRISPLFIGFYSATALKSNIEKWTRRLKVDFPTVPIVVGGPAYPSYEEFHSYGCDVVCFAEGDYAVVEIADALLGLRDLAGVKGISYLKDGVVIKNEGKGRIEDLDSIPFPNRDKTPVGAYVDYHLIGMQTPYVTMITSRGCPFTCAYCSSPTMWGNNVRLRSVDNVLEEIDLIVAKYGVRYIGFKDDIFGLKYSWVKEFCAGLIERNYDLRWSCNLHPFSFKGHRKEALSLMERAGFDAFVVGLQTVDPEVMKSISRDPKEVESVFELLKVAREVDIHTVLEFIFGLPGETEESRMASEKFAREAKPLYAMFYSLVLIEGAEFFTEKTSLDEFGHDPEFVRKRIKDASRRFYTDPGVVSRILSRVVRKNPGWLVKGVKALPYLVHATGVARSRVL